MALSPISVAGARERLTRFADTLSVNRHYMTGQTCREIQADLHVLLRGHPIPDEGELAELCRQLRRTEPRLVGIATNATAPVQMTQQQVLVNPDGPAAADMIAVLVSVRQSRLDDSGLMEFRQIIEKIERQAECLEGYAVQAGHEAKPVPSVFHSQASHFRTYAGELRALLASLTGRGEGK